MEYQVKKQENNEAQIEYQVSFEEFEPFLEKAYQAEKGKYAIPGFRKGKVPRKMLELRFGKELFYDEALNLMIPDLYDESIEKLGLDPVVQPTFAMDSMEAETGIVFHADVVLKPEVKLGEYKDLVVEKHDTQVSDEEVEEDLKREQNKNARLVPLSERSSREGDVLTIDFEGFIDGEPFEGGKAEGHELELGSGSFIPGFEDQLQDKNVGDEVDVEVTFPENYHEELKGKEALFKVKIHDIKAKELPELNDEFAQDVSEFDTLEEMKEDIRKRLQKSKEDHAVMHRGSDAMKKAVENMEVVIPEAMVEQEVESMINNYRHQMQSSGLSLEQYLQYTGMDLEGLKTQLRGDAEMQIKTSLLLEAVAQAENFEITEEEINQEITSMSERFGRSEDEIRKVYGSDEYEYLKKNLQLQKARDLIQDSAREE